MPENKHVGIMHPTYNKRLLFFITIDMIVFFASIVLSFAIRLGATHLGEFIYEIAIFFTIIAFFKIAVMSLYRVYAITWKYFSIKDAIKVVIALTIAQIIASLIIYFCFYKETYIIVPRTLFFLDYFISVFAVLGLRSIRRFFIIYFRKSDGVNHNVIVYGAGDGGEQIIRDMLQGNSFYYPVAIVDDDISKKNSLIHGIRVEGTLNDVSGLARRREAQTVIIAIPSMGRERLQTVYDYLIENNIRNVKILPPADEILNERITVKSLKDIDIMDLIGRETVNIDVSLIVNYLNNKTVLVTGAGGSIGSEIVHQVSRFDVREIIALDIDETELFYLRNRISSEHNKDITLYLADVRDSEHISQLFGSKRIDIVFHAAALKHVPICEEFPLEAVKTNILGTHNIISSSKESIEKFILISTDKAVNPTSVMGATKRICEFLVKNAAGGSTVFSAVRFGNVLGSRGSVVPLFKKQIERGGPVTITHPDMKRFFMTIPEAVLLVLEAGGAARGGEIFILDMGEPVLIRDIAMRMIKMYGYNESDIEIIYTGIRPGEKMYEELVMDEEGTQKTRFEKIFKAKSGYDFPDTPEIINRFANVKNGDETITQLLSIIPSYKNE